MIGKKQIRDRAFRKSDNAYQVPLEFVPRFAFAHQNLYAF